MYLLICAAGKEGPLFKYVLTGLLVAYIGICAIPQIYQTKQKGAVNKFTLLFGCNCLPHSVH
ncbi:hypothetical protein EDM54_03585 [Brevibacillus borstelensis]|uniref:Uncharacterized protein n=1 Tax=Brevibacillus borstelensis AK1 TaxID=1300222 RepID=M8E530_9BACL|nr:hypothetical protein I532_21895 [Brevibacillus borstelensis AK1]KKX56996.1 hypothetical protein X546_00200 [Brevibacillus borstelensis cifa_chp40]RNB65695.1 hypothetical protein EDM54_03585 [Brevibacillus borstelensis]